MLNRRSLLLALGFAFAAPMAPALAADTVVFAASSLQNALDDAVKAYTAETGKTVTVSYGGSSALAKQIEAAAPADIFFSADLAWMKDLHDKSLTVADTEKAILGNEIVLVAPKDSTAAATIAPGFDIGAVLGADGKLAMANVDSVPAGKYGKAALEKLGVWDRVSAQVVQSDNVRAALAFVAKGEAAAGIVYQTDAPQTRTRRSFIRSRCWRLRPIRTPRISSRIWSPTRPRRHLRSRDSRCSSRLRANIPTVSFRRRPESSVRRPRGRAHRRRVLGPGLRRDDNGVWLTTHLR
jgi:molybdate transport system substrate-binding protein